ncbi:hypothetical protein Scep_019857 [Stephania cephalantha]|uniref:Uncharacterized protein n=1 Tax=Stephania cephalantha TaxID=152367 RepID=A0AAP0IBZ1_9MAGN
MGSCFSSDQYESIGSIETAKVISVSGSLREYPNYVTVSQALEAEPTTSTAFLCNSDNLYYDEFVQPLDSDDYLEVGQIYFVLPKARLQKRLTASDMAALAVKASVALSGAGLNNKSGGGKGLFGRNRKIKVLPVLEVKERVGGEELEKRYDDEKMMVMMRRSGSVKKLKRSASRRVKFVYRSFKVRLSTIHEGTVAN